MATLIQCTESVSALDEVALLLTLIVVLWGATNTLPSTPLSVPLICIPPHFPGKLRVCKRVLFPGLKIILECITVGVIVLNGLQ